MRLLTLNSSEAEDEKSVTAPNQIMREKSAVSFSSALACLDFVDCLFAGCLLLVACSACCLLFVVCCLLFVVCCLLFVVCCLLLGPSVEARTDRDSSLPLPFGHHFQTGARRK